MAKADLYSQKGLLEIGHCPKDREGKGNQELHGHHITHISDIHMLRIY